VNLFWLLLLGILKDAGLFGTGDGKGCKKAALKLLQQRLKLKAGAGTNIKSD